MHLFDNFADFIEGHICPGHSDEGAFSVIHRLGDADHLDLRAPFGKVGFSDEDPFRLFGAAIPGVRIVVEVISQSCRLGPTLAVYPSECRGLLPILIIQNHIDSIHCLNLTMFQQGGEPWDRDAPLFFIGYLVGGNGHGKHRHPVHQIIHGVNLIMNLLESLVRGLLEQEISAAEVAGESKRDQNNSSTGTDGQGKALSNRAGGKNS